MAGGVGEYQHRAWTKGKEAGIEAARARDKYAALKEIFEMPDPKAFVARSGRQAGR
jgi:hypothetical protein